MIVADIMTIPNRTLQECELVDDAAALMPASEQNHLLVLRDGRPVGTIAAGDVSPGHGRREQVQAAMQRSTIAFEPTTPLHEALLVMTRNALRAAPVVDMGGALTGLVTLLDAMTATIAASST